jgi:hypothetical protein
MNSVVRAMLIMYVKCVSGSDTLNPHNFRFPGTPGCRPRSASGHNGCSLVS